MNSKLKVIASSSLSNSYALVTSTGTLLIEAGVSIVAVRRHIDFSKVVGCIISHKHNDHARYVRDFAARVPVGGPAEAIEACAIRQGHALIEGRQFSFGPFDVTPFSVPHSNADGSDCQNYGYLIYHPDTAYVLFATDTYVLPYRFKSIRHFIIEANYDDEILEEEYQNGKTSRAQRDRVIFSHMALKNTIESIRQCGTELTKTITLIHLSERHSDKKKFQRAVEAEFGIPTYIAGRKGEVILESSIQI